MGPVQVMELPGGTDISVSVVYIYLFSYWSAQPIIQYSILQHNIQYDIPQHERDDRPRHESYLRLIV